MKTAIVIPARYASTRYPGKPRALSRAITRSMAPPMTAALPTTRGISAPR